MRLTMILTLSVMLGACSESSTLPPFTGGQEGGTLSAQLTPTGDAPGPAREAVIGQNRNSDIASLQYHMTLVLLCQRLALNEAGTEIDSPQDCLVLFEAQDAADDAEALVAARGSNDGYVDLVNADSRAAFRPSLQLDMRSVGTYRYGFIYWRSAIKMKAQLEVSVPDGTGAGFSTQTWYTRDGASSQAACAGEVCPRPQTQVSGHFSDGSAAEEAVLIDPESGTLFELFSPLRITEDDITQKTDFVLDLLFDLDGVVFGASEASCDPNNGLVDSGVHDYSSDTPGSCNVLTVPRPVFAPVVRHADEVLTKEVYSGRVAGLGYDPSGKAASSKCTDDLLPACRQNFELRLSLYTSQTDGTSTVRAADLRAVVSHDASALSANNTDSLRVPRIPLLGAISVYGDGSLDIQTLDRVPLLTGFKRPAAATPGSEVSVMLACGPGVLSFAGCGVEGVVDEIFNPSSVAVSLSFESTSTR